jgi:hypothetical protein
MSAQAARRAETPARHSGEPVRVAFVGAASWLARSAPQAAVPGLDSRCLPVAAEISSDEHERWLVDIGRFSPHATVVFDPASLPQGVLETLPGVTLGVLVDGPPRGGNELLGGIDRLVSFLPELTGTRVAGGTLWRAIPPPIAESFYASSATITPIHHEPRAMSLGRSTQHREAMLMPAKHHHDLLQVIFGVEGERLAQLVRRYDVGVFIARGEGGGFGWQVGMHLAAGQLLLTEELVPRHGLERNIDYLQIESPDELVWVLGRLGRFPEMHHRVRVRGRLKAEQYRASGVFARLTHDLLADVAAFGGARGGR